MPPKPTPAPRAPAQGRPSATSESASSTPAPSGSGRGGSASGSRGRPVQRLQSLKKREQGGSLVPLNADGSTPKPVLKYQPKFVARRSKAEREAMERLEAERERERISGAVAARKVPTRGGDRGRGRGRGRGAFGGSGAGGPLGDGGSGRSSGPRWSNRHGGRSSRRAGGGFGVKTEDGGGHVGGGYDYSSDEGSDSGPRFSIDHINLADDSDTENYDVGKGKMPAKTQYSTSFRGLRPIRVERHEHIERSIGINTESSTNKSAELRREAKAKAKANDDDDSLFVAEDEEEDVVMGEAKAVRPATEEGPRIKAEPTDDDAIITDNIPAATDEQAGDKADLEKQPKPKKTVPVIDPRSKLQTEEERREYDRHEEDIEYLKQALGSISTVDKAPDTIEGEEGEKKEEAQQKYDRNGRLFLIQFPPITPNLVLPTPEQLDGDSDAVVEVSQQQQTKPSSSQTPGTVTIKKEDGTTTTVALPTPIPSNSPATITATNTTLRPGRVGKLQVHQSGRTTMDWGGVSFELTKGSDVDFLQDAVVASDPTAGENKSIWAMSQVSGKFVVTPDWEKLLDE